MREPTDPTGVLFISYRRTRAPEVARVVRALRDRGVPTWLDTDDLAAEPTGDGLRHILADPATSSAVLYLTPEVAGSDTIREIEAPAIMRRHDRGDGFWVQPVAAGGLDYAAAAALLSGRIGAEDIARWNIFRAYGDPATRDDAVALARLCLVRRLQALHTALPDDVPIKMRLHARGTAAREPGTALELDWSGRFVDRTASPKAWAALAVAITDVAVAVRTHCPGRDMVAMGSPAMPTAVLLGSAFSTRDACRLSWQQRQPAGVSGSAWSLAEAPGPRAAEIAGWGVKVSGHDPSADACAVLINVSDDTHGAFGASHAVLPKWRSILNVSCSTQAKPLDAQQAASLAWLITGQIRAARTEYGPFASVHLFLAAPAGLAVLIGTLLATLPTVVTYEYDTATGQYVAAVEIHP